MEQNKLLAFVLFPR